MSAHSLPLNLQKALENKFFHIDDPGSAGTFDLDGKGHGLCEVITAGAESRTLPAVGGVEVGNRLTVFFKTDGGDLTITGSDQTIVLTATGQFVTFVVAFTTVKVWRVAEDSRVAFTDIAALQVDVQGANLIAIPLHEFYVHDAFHTPLPAEAAAADDDDLEMRTPAIGTDAAAITATVSAATVVKEALAAAVVPANYQAGDAISIVIPWVREDAATTSASIDLTAYRSAAPTVDICATALQDINAAASGTATFVLTPTNVVPGETILLNLLAAINDGTTSKHSFKSVNWSFTV